LTLAWIEPLAVITALLAVGLGVLGQRITWLFWVLSSALFGWIFAEAKLWADCGLQVMFFFAALWGWRQWGRRSFQPVAMGGRARLVAVAVALLCWLGLYALLLLLGGRAALGDAFVGSASLVAQILMVRQRLEHWLFWLAANLAAVLLFWSQNLKATAGLYLLFALMAVGGYWHWKRQAFALGQEPLGAGEGT